MIKTFIDNGSIVKWQNITHNPDIIYRGCEEDVIYKLHKFKISTYNEKIRVRIYNKSGNYYITETIEPYSMQYYYIPCVDESDYITFEIDGVIS